MPKIETIEQMKKRLKFHLEKAKENHDKSIPNRNLLMFYDGKIEVLENLLYEIENGFKDE